MLAYPQAVRPGLTTLGPQWNAARSTHHRIAWLARESSKPGRPSVERWTVQASPAWSAEHLEDDAERVQAKLIKAFAEVTGIRAQPAHAQTQRWRYAQTTHPWAAATCGTPNWAWVPAATGAWATAWKMPSCPDWSWHSPWHERRRGPCAGPRVRLHRPFCAVADRAPACRLAGGRPGQLARRPRLQRRAWRSLAGAHRGRGHPALHPGCRRDHPAAVGRLRPGAR